MNDLQDKARELDQLVHLSLTEPFSMSEGAMLLSVVVDDAGTYVVTLVDQRTDVYEMLEDSTASAVSKVSDYVAIVTTGWASPVDNEEVAPSQHPERRRVRLLMFADHSSTASVVRFEDDPEVASVSEGGHGTLANAVFAMLDRARTR